jgi:hypothetical protein
MIREHNLESSRLFAAKPRRSTALQDTVQRYAFTYLALQFFPAPLTTIMPGIGDWVEQWIRTTIWLPIVRVIATQWLHTPGEVISVQTGSGDTLFDYVRTLLCLVLAVVIVALWSFFFRRRLDNVMVAAIFRLWLRYTLAAYMLTYGAVKVFNLQFGALNPVTLMKTYGESSPMNLLWTFMSFSPAYTVFSGLMEVIPGTLLLFRRTYWVGAWLTVGVMANVVMLNFCYDVPVKILSSHLLVLALLIALPNAYRLLKIMHIVSDEVASEEGNPIARVRNSRIRPMAKSLFVLGIVGANALMMLQHLAANGEKPDSLAIAGTYVVDSYVRDGAEIPPLLHDNGQPHYLSVVSAGDAMFVAISMMSGEKHFFAAQFDRDNHRVKLEERGNPSASPRKYSWQWSDGEHGLETIEGPFQGAAIAAKIRKVENDDFPLVSRGFHWVNEVPFNR